MINENVTENTEVVVVGFPDPFSPSATDFVHRCALKDSLPAMEKRLEEMSLEEKMMAFFDNGDMEAKYKILLSMREEITDTIIDNLAVDVDVVIPDGEINKRFDDLRKAIQTRQKYEQNSRLR